MVDRYTEDQVVESVNGYEIEIELPGGDKARLAGTSVSRLLSIANELYRNKNDANWKQTVDDPT